MNNVKTKLTPVRYPGGKSNALKYLNDKVFSILNFNDLKEYREPFFGGGSVGLYLMQQHKSMVYKINDLFYPVYCFWNVLYNNPYELIEYIQNKKSQYHIYNDIPDKNIKPRIPTKNAINGKQLHSLCRQEIEQTILNKNELLTAGNWYILNKTSFSGMSMIGSYAPLAWDQNFTDKCIKNLINTHILMKSVKKIEITNLDYSELLTLGGEDVFIFLDPPYKIDHNLYGNNGDLHEQFSHEKFADDIKKCKHKWVITYNNNLDIKTYFNNSEYYITEWDLVYTMKSAIRVNENQTKSLTKLSKQGKELLIKNWK